MSVEFINWYWIYSASIWGMYVIWRVSVRPSGAGLVNMSCQECTFSYMYTGQLPPGARFAGAQFAATKFPWGPICHQGAQSARARFAGAQFAAKGPNLPGPDLPGPNLPGPNLPPTSFPGPNLPHPKFSGAQSTRAKFARAQSAGAQFATKNHLGQCNACN